MDAQTRDPSDADRHVSFYTKDVTVKSDGDDDSNSRIEVPVSGLAEDRDGDKLADAAIESMVSQINAGGVPMFPNHGYDAENGVPMAYRFEDIIGGWVSAERDGDTVVAEAELRDGADAVADLKDLFEQGMPVGFSIGFGWDEDSAEQRDDGGLRFTDLDLMEISPVGIQSHPDASTADGLKLASVARDAGIDPDALADAITNEMTDDDTPDDTEEPDADDGETKDDATDGLKVTEDELQAIFGIMEAHHNAAMEDIRDELDLQETEESDADDGEEEDDTETEASDDDDEDDDKAAELRAELETVKAELEAMKTDAAGSTGPKGGIRTTEDGETKDAEGDGSDDNSDTVTREFAGNLV